jgi:hypothetical protein
MAIFKIRRAASASPSLTAGELFLNYTTGTIQFASGSSNAVVNLLPLGKSITGNINLNGNITATNITTTGDLTIGGNLFLGDSIADNIVITGELSSSIIPNDDNEFDLGSNSKKWKNLYAVSASIDDITLNGTGIVSSSQQISNYNTFLEIDGMGVFSGSSQVNANTITNFDSNVKDKMNDDSVISGSSQLTTEFDTRYLNTNGDSVISSSAQLTTEFDTRYLNTDGDSVISSSAQLTTEFDTRYLNTNGDGVISSSAQLDSVFLEINGDGVFSGSSQVNADSITNFDSNVKDKMNADGVISSSAQIEGDFLEVNGDSVVSSSAQISGYNTFLEINGDGVVSGSSQINSLFVGTAVSTSLDSRLDSLETDSHTHANKANLDTINQDLATTDNVTFDTGSFTGNVTVTGNLTVLGSATEIQTSELRIEDKLITVASGSVDSTAADGAGLEIDGANKSLTWDHNSTSFVFDAKVSSSVGFKGEGGELTGIDTDQVTEAGNLYYTNTRVLDYINDQGVISGSSQVNADSVTNFDSNVLSYINDLGVVSGSAQLENVFLEINGDSVVSGSQQVIDLLPTGVVSGSAQLTTEFDTRYLNTNSDSVVSGSSQIDVTATTNYSSINQYSDTKVKTKLTAENVLSSSQQVVDSLPSGLVSGSSQITDGSGIVSSSTFQSNQQGSFTSSINGTDTNIDLGLEISDSPTFSGLSLSGVSELGAAEVSALVSGSAGSVGYRVLGTAAFLNVSNSIDNDQNVIPTNFAVNQALISAGAGDITSVNPSSTYGSGETTGLLHTGDGTDVGGVYGTQGDIVIAIATGSSHFTDGVVSALPNGLVSQSAQIDVTATTNYSSINQYSDSKVLDYINDLGVQSGSDTVDYTDADTLAYINDLGVHSGSFLGTATTSNLSEGSNLYYTDARVSTRTDTILNHSNHTNISVSKVGNELRFSAASSYGDSDVTDHLDSLGVISGSSQLTTEFDTRYLNTDSDGVHSGSFLGTATTSNLSEGSNLYYTDARVLDYIHNLGVVSGSSQLEGFVSASGGFTANETIIATGTNSVTSSNILALDTTNNYLGINQSNPEVTLHMTGEGAQTAQIRMEQYNDSADAPDVRTRRYRGSSGSPEAVQAGDYLFRSNHEFWNGSALITGGSFGFDNTNNAARTQFAISVTTDGTSSDINNASKTQFKIDGNDSGAITFNNSYKFPTSDGTNGQTLVTNGSGVLSFGDLTSLLPSGIVSGSDQLSGSLVTLDTDQTITGLKTFQDIVVNGTGSFAYIQSVTGSAKIIGDAYIILNNDTPTERYAGIAVYDSGSAGVTASLEFDGQTNDWFYEYSDDGGVTTDHGVVMFGPEYSGKGSPTYNTNNRVLKSNGGHHTLDSNITDTGTLITLGSDTTVNGTLESTGDVVAYASSDKRLKDNIQPISNPLEKINLISGNSFVWNEEKQNIYKGKDYGVIAQEIEEILPELVQTREDGYKAVKYDKLVSLLIEGIKELSKEVSELKNKIGE